MFGDLRRHRLTVARARYNAQVPTALPVHANVAFLRIARFDTRPVAEQALLKEKLEARAKAATAGIPEPDRIVLDADDGLPAPLFRYPPQPFPIPHPPR